MTVSSFISLAETSAAWLWFWLQFKPKLPSGRRHWNSYDHNNNMARSRCEWFSVNMAVTKPERRRSCRSGQDVYGSPAATMYLSLSRHRPKSPAQSRSCGLQSLPRSLPQPASTEWQRQRFSMVGAFIILPFHVQLAAKSKVTAPHTQEAKLASHQGGPSCIVFFRKKKNHIFRVCHRSCAGSVCVCVCVCWSADV